MFAFSLLKLFPAYAGVIPDKGAISLQTKSFPRLRGGDPHEAIERLTSVTFSPPTRGFHIDNPAQKADNRFILNAERGKVYAVF